MRTRALRRSAPSGCLPRWRRARWTSEPPVARRRPTRWRRVGSDGTAPEGRLLHRIGASRMGRVRAAPDVPARHATHATPTRVDDAAAPHRSPRERGLRSDRRALVQRAITAVERKRHWRARHGHAHGRMQRGGATNQCVHKCWFKPSNARVLLQGPSKGCAQRTQGARAHSLKALPAATQG